MSRAFIGIPIFGKYIRVFKAFAKDGENSSANISDVVQNDPFEDYLFKAELKDGLRQNYFSF